MNDAQELNRRPEIANRYWVHGRLVSDVGDMRFFAEPTECHELRSTAA